MIFALLTLLAALSLAAVAGWFSIIGIMSIYAGAAFHAVIMGVVLECGKLVTTSWLYRNWNYSTWKIKIPLIVFTLILMLTTSIGVFGFLSKAHLDQGSSTIDNAAKVERIEQQIIREQKLITDSERMISQLDATINSYLGKDRADRSVIVRRSQAPQRKQLKDDIAAAQKQIDALSDEKLNLQSEVRKLQLDVGPIRYISELVYGVGETEKNIDLAVRMFTLLIVSTLDPLAVVLLIAANQTIMRREHEKKEKIVSNSPVRENIDVLPDIHNEVSNEANTTNVSSGVESTFPSENSKETTTHNSIFEKTVGLLNEDENTPIPQADLGSGRSSEVHVQRVNSEELSDVVETAPSESTLKKEVQNQAQGIIDVGVTVPTQKRVREKRVSSKARPYGPDEAVLHELVGSIPPDTQHFVAKLIDTQTARDNTRISENVDKYPKALSWLDEFKKG